MTSKEIEELAGHRQVSAWVVKLVNDAIAAQKKEWVGLTDDEIIDTANMAPFDTMVSAEDYIYIISRAIEAKLKEKNGG